MRLIKRQCIARLVLFRLSLFFVFGAIVGLGSNKVKRKASMMKIWLAASARKKQSESLFIGFSCHPRLCFSTTSLDVKHNSKFEGEEEELSNETANKFVVVRRGGGGGRGRRWRERREKMCRGHSSRLSRRKYVSLLYIKQIFVSNFATTLVDDIAQRAVDSLGVVKRTTKESEVFMTRKTFSSCKRATGWREINVIKALWLSFRPS
jgi:hypothetical protein